jgi:aryl-alcohol dehydrogenase-like predicted oxidoreductase
VSNLVYHYYAGFNASYPNESGVTAPIIGTTSLANLKDLLGAVHIKLSEEEIKSLEEPYVPQGVLGHT